ncbi:TetR/AcrR family transcriptional regulator [Arthrobacter sp. JCM 19049]|uniref:TetR/AcrR family transcriptional regulator n=1 Tax=Arthrobacter sp. JCM 19049 TaxID=1460643 RepID=UPI000A79D8CB|nr:TetR/AcrR family transcriptional regulator [Arthrobacter sp. JCM 19049]
MTTDSSGTRREMNKQATRQAIVDAALTLLRNQGREAMTATAIAEAAGISRRTLFNYFPTVDAVLAEPLQRLLDRVVEVLAESTQELPLITAAIRALQGAGVPQLLEPVAYLGIYAEDCSHQPAVASRTSGRTPRGTSSPPLSASTRRPTRSRCGSSPTSCWGPGRPPSRNGPASWRSPPVPRPTPPWTFPRSRSRNCIRCSPTPWSSCVTASRRF